VPCQRAPPSPHRATHPEVFPVLEAMVLILLPVILTAAMAASPLVPPVVVVVAASTPQPGLVLLQRNFNAPGAALRDKEDNCLCIFDVDRTLTGQQGSVGRSCPGNRYAYGIWDRAYSGGWLTLSALGAEGLGRTFCNACYLGIVSAGDASGEGSAERRHLLEHVLVTPPQQDLVARLPAAKSWSYGGHITSPFVLLQADRTKHLAVESIVDWYEEQGGITIPHKQVHFFGDRTENIGPFLGMGFNAREISCVSRDMSIHHGMVGRCGATVEEIVATKGVKTCQGLLQVQEEASNAIVGGEDQDVGSEEQERCLCVFDIDRTLTGKQGSAGSYCPRNREIGGVHDTAYFGGTLTLSALGAQGLFSTFCGECYLGVVSAGDASGEKSAERRYLTENVLLSRPQQELEKVNAQATHWSHADNVVSPFVLVQPDGTKQVAVEHILDWYLEQGIEVPASRVHFFGDRTGNIGPFAQKGYNAKEISCASRDNYFKGAVGLCGAMPEEITPEAGVHLCSETLNFIFPASHKLAPDEPPPRRLCCTAMTAACLACAEGVSVNVFCASPKHTRVAGCSMPAHTTNPTKLPAPASSGDVCCAAMTAVCLSCQRGVTVTAFCAEQDHAGVAGCKTSLLAQPQETGSKMSEVCCSSFTAECLACKMGISAIAFCAEPDHAKVVGCEALSEIDDAVVALVDSTPQATKQVSRSSGEQCCQSIIAECIACNLGITVVALCADPDYARVQGCDEEADAAKLQLLQRSPSLSSQVVGGSGQLCCTALVASCMACEHGISVKAFCALPDHAGVQGCGLSAPPGF